MKNSSIRKIAISNLILIMVLFFLGLSVAAVVVGIGVAIQQEEEEARHHLTILLMDIDRKELRRFYTETANYYEKREKKPFDKRADFLKDKDYKDLRQKLEALRLVAGYKDISFVFHDKKRDRIVYVVNADEKDIHRPGEWESAAANDVPDITRMKQLYSSAISLDIRPDADTGWKVSYYAPMGSKGKEFGSCVFDIYPYEILMYIKLLLLFGIPLFLGLILTFAFLLARFLGIRLIRPIVGISDAANRFIHLDSEALMNGSRIFAGLETGDKTPKEIAVLVNDMKQMEERVAASLLEIRGMTEEKERIDAELSFAANIQRAMLPPVTEEYTAGNGFSLYALMRPAREVGGDFYDFFKIDEDHLAFLVADVSDKGMGAALFMAISKSVIRSLAYTGGSPSQVLRRADVILSDGNEEGMFVTVFFGILDLKTGRVTVCNAGHDYPMVCFAGEGDRKAYCMREEDHGAPLAFLPGIKLPELGWTLSPGDRIFLYTDGVNEAMVGDSEQFGTERMVEILNQNKEQDDRMLCEAMLGAVDAYMEGNPQFDDITMLSVTYLGRG